MIYSPCMPAMHIEPTGKGGNRKNFPPGGNTFRKLCDSLAGMADVTAIAIFRNRSTEPILSAGPVIHSACMNAMRLMHSLNYESRSSISSYFDLFRDKKISRQMNNQATRKPRTWMNVDVSARRWMTGAKSLNLCG